jgi:DNA-binding HxlR family transcriptional regulator
MFGRTRFTEFRTNLGIAPDILSARLAHLVEQGLLRREEYRQPGFRGRLEYRLTPDGLALHPLIAALGEWGENARPVAGGTSPRFAVASTGTPVRLAFVTEDGEVINPRDIAVERGVPSAAG